MYGTGTTPAGTPHLPPTTDHSHGASSHPPRDTSPNPPAATASHSGAPPSATPDTCAPHGTPLQCRAADCYCATSVCADDRGAVDCEDGQQHGLRLDALFPTDAAKVDLRARDIFLAQEEEAKEMVRHLEFPVLIGPPDRRMRVHQFCALCDHSHTQGCMCGIFQGCVEDSEHACAGLWSGAHAFGLAGGRVHERDEPAAAASRHLPRR